MESNNRQLRRLTPVNRGSTSISKYVDYIMWWLVDTWIIMFYYIFIICEGSGVILLDWCWEMIGRQYSGCLWQCLGVFYNGLYCIESQWNDERQRMFSIIPSFILPLFFFCSSPSLVFHGFILQLATYCVLRKIKSTKP